MQMQDCGVRGNIELDVIKAGAALDDVMSRCDRLRWLLGGTVVDFGHLHPHVNQLLTPVVTPPTAELHPGTLAETTHAASDARLFSTEGTAERPRARCQACIATQRLRFVGADAWAGRCLTNEPTPLGAYLNMHAKKLIRYDGAFVLCPPFLHWWLLRLCNSRKTPNAGIAKMTRPPTPMPY